MRNLLTIFLLFIVPLNSVAQTLVSAGYNQQEDLNRSILTQPRDINPRIFGAKGDGRTDDTKAIQAAIDSAIRVSGGTVYLPDRYKITAPIIAANFINGEYRQVFFKVEGNGTMWDNGSVSTITATFNDAPIFSIQKGKGCIVRGVTFQGPGIGRDSRYSPQAAICLDPFSGLVPADGGYPTLKKWYRGPQSRSGSTGCRFEDVTTGGTTVGVIISPNGYTQNGEIMTFQNIRFGVHKYGFVGCQAQEKLNRLINVAAWSDMECLFQFNTYGAGQPGNYIIDGVNIAGSVKKIIHRASSGWGPMFMTNVFAESIHSIGEWSTNGGDALSNALINLATTDEIGRFSPYCLQGDGLTIEKSLIRYYGKYTPVLIIGRVKASGASFDFPPVSGKGRLDIENYKGFQASFAAYNMTIVKGKGRTNETDTRLYKPAVGETAILMGTNSYPWRGLSEVDSVWKGGFSVKFAGVPDGVYAVGIYKK